MVFTGKNLDDGTNFMFKINDHFITNGNGICFLDFIQPDFTTHTAIILLAIICQHINTPPVAPN